MNLSHADFFNWRLAHIAQVGYARCVQFETRNTNASVAPSQSRYPLTQAGTAKSATGPSETPAPERRRYVLSDATVAYRADKARRNQKRRSPAFFQQAKAQLDLLTLVDES